MSGYRCIVKKSVFRHQEHFNESKDIFLRQLTLFIKKTTLPISYHGKYIENILFQRKHLRINKKNEDEERTIVWFFVHKPLWEE